METISPRSSNGIPTEKLDLNGSNNNNNNNSNDPKKQVIYTRDHFHTEFDTNAYLKDFYTKIEDPAMQLVLTFLPSIVARLPQRKRLLDFGAGPTIHVAACFRNSVDEVYLADYLPQNREELQRWKDGKSSFDWGAALRMMLTREGKDWSKVAETEKETRAKVCDIFYANCFEQPSIQCGKDLEQKFDIITSFFTMEYCCNTKEEYATAIRNVVEQVIPGGYFIMGGILEETWCSFGGRKFTCLFITKDFMLDCLRNAGLEVDDEKTYLLEVNGMFLVCAKKGQ